MELRDYPRERWPPWLLSLCTYWRPIHWLGELRVHSSRGCSSDDGRDGWEYWQVSCTLTTHRPVPVPHWVFDAVRSDFGMRDATEDHENPFHRMLFLEVG